jgi:hypothetical protein
VAPLLTPTPTPAPTAFHTSQAVTASASSIASPLTTHAPANPGFTQWDYQAKGTVVAAAFAIGAGALLWGLWALLRTRLTALYAPRSWFLPPGYVQIVEGRRYLTPAPGLQQRRWQPPSSPSSTFPRSTRPPPTPR